MVGQPKGETRTGGMTATSAAGWLVVLTGGQGVLRSVAQWALSAQAERDHALQPEKGKSRQKQNQRCRTTWHLI